MSSLPRVSVITVVYNRVASIENTLLSVIDQDYQNVEYIIVDGGSTDGTVDIIRKYERRIARWVSEPDKGIYDAMNKGIAMATGKWINFMNCGDRFASNNVLSLFEKMNLDADIIYGDAIIQYPGFNARWPVLPLDNLWKRAAFCHQATFADSALMKEMKFDTRFRVSADFDFIFRAWRMNRKFEYVREVICYYDFREGASIDQQFRSLRERKEAVLQNNFTWLRWGYFTSSQLYLRIAFIVKKIIGPRLTRWITRSLKR